MFNKRSLEGYFSSDNRASGGTLFEAPILTCSHCQKQIIVNPLRIRDRGYCAKCDHYVCDQCEIVRVQTGRCRTFKQLMDEVCEKAIKEKLIYG